MRYYLADGKYPPYPSFARHYARPITPHERTYNTLQEPMRKDVQRLHSVLTKCFNVALHPARISSITQIVATGKAIPFLHKMVEGERREGFVSRSRIAAAAELVLLIEDDDGGASGGGGGGPAAGGAAGGCDRPLRRGAKDGASLSKGGGGGAGSEGGAAGAPAASGGGGQGAAAWGRPQVGRDIGRGHPPARVPMAAGSTEGWFQRSQAARAAVTNEFNVQNLCK